VLRVKKKPTPVEPGWAAEAGRDDRTAGGKIKWRMRTPAALEQCSLVAGSFDGKTSVTRV